MAMKTRLSLPPPLLPLDGRRSSPRRARRTRSSKGQSGKESAMLMQRQPHHHHHQLLQLQPALQMSTDLGSRAQRQRRARCVRPEGRHAG